MRCLGRKATGRASGDAAAFPCFCFLSWDLRSGLSLRWGSVRALWGAVTPTELGLGQAQFSVFLSVTCLDLGVLRELILHLGRTADWSRLEGTSGVHVQLPPPGLHAKNRGVWL